MEILERVAELDQEMERKVEMSDCAIAGEDRGLTPDLVAAAP